MRKLLDRTQKDVEEEQMLLNELKKIEARKKERDRKTQDLQKLISQADQVCFNVLYRESMRRSFIIYGFVKNTARRNTRHPSQRSETREKG